MMRLALVTSLVAMLASFLYQATSPAYACSCSGPPSSRTEARTWIGRLELGVIAHPNGYTSDDKDGLLVMKVTRVLNGPSVDSITLPQTRWTMSDEEFEKYRPEVMGSDCSYNVVGREEDLYFLNLWKNTEGEWETNVCGWSSALSTISYGGVVQPIGLALIDEFGPDALDPSGPLSEAKHGDAPEPLLWIGAALVPLAFLLLWAMIKPRGGGH